MINRQEEAQRRYEESHSGIFGFITKVTDTVSGWLGGSDGKPPQIEIPDMQYWVDRKTSK